MKRLVLLLVPLVAACGLSDPGRPPDAAARGWALVYTGQPGAWHGAKLTWDGQRGGVVMYGGRHAATDVEDGKLYLWKNNAWTPICPNAPSPRYLPGFAWDPVSGKLVVVGGSYDGSGFQTLASDVYSCDQTGAWTHEGQLSGIQLRAGAELVWNDHRKQLMLIGGRNQLNQLHDVYTSTDDGATWQLSSTTLPFDCAGAGQNAAYDSSNQRVLALAGELSAGTVDPLMFHDEVWQLSMDDLQWVQVCTNCSGVARSDASIVHFGAGSHDTAENYVINGYLGGTADVDGTWLLDNNRLTLSDAAQPQKRNGIGVAYDEVRDRLVAFGGTGQSCLIDAECNQTLELR